MGLPALYAAGPALTIYNQNFAVVREQLPLDLKDGITRVRFSGVTAYVEPESVTLRDPGAAHSFRVLEQSYRADPISVQALLAAYEGKTIQFQVRSGDQTSIVEGRIVRATPPDSGVVNYSYMRADVVAAPQAIIEVNGQLRFDLPGIPLFPSLSGDAILKPSLEWLIHSAGPARFDAELAYVTAAMNWQADYNIVQTASDRLEIIGWVTMENRTGHKFENASVKLMAGDVNKIVRPDLMQVRMGGAIGGIIGGVPGGLPAVTEKTFDEYHLYTLPAPVTLFDRQSKQVEFIHASNIQARIVYLYDGLKFDLNRARQMPPEALRMDTGFGLQSTNKVWVMREFTNSKVNQLGLPLPKGRTRFYRRDTDGQLEFTGEDTIDHTPAGESIRVFTGAAFDLVGDRKRTSYRIDHGRSTIDESFEIKVRNRKQEQAEVLVVEHMYRWNTWEIPVSSQPWTKKDSDTIEFKVVLQPGEEKTVAYAVRYTW